MNSEKVAVLMSTYNGEKYIKEQLESLINQTYKNIEIYIRDDGSKDKTIKVIEKYQQKNKNIHLIKGENIGFINSFFELLKCGEDAQFFAYCDQDDVWMENKIQRAIEHLRDKDTKKPLLYFSNVDYYDGDMTYLATAEKDRIYNFRNSLVECVTQGMTMVVNKETRDLILNKKPKSCLYHDWWTYMICAGFGEIIYDNESLVKYRRHNSSVTVEGKSKIELLKFRIKQFLVGDSLKQIKKQIKEYEEYYENKLNEEDKKLLKLFTKEKYSFINAIKKVFYKKRFRRKLADEISVRILFLFGKL